MAKQVFEKTHVVPQTHRIDGDVPRVTIYRADQASAVPNALHADFLGRDALVRDFLSKDERKQLETLLQKIVEGKLKADGYELKTVEENEDA